MKVPRENRYAVEVGEVIWVPKPTDPLLQFES